MKFEELEIVRTKLKKYDVPANTRGTIVFIEKDIYTVEFQEGFEDYLYEYKENEIVKDE